MARTLDLSGLIFFARGRASGGSKVYLPKELTGNSGRIKGVDFRGLNLDNVHGV